MTCELKYIDKLLLYEYINVCKCVDYFIIENIVNSIDTNIMNNVEIKFDEISIKYNIPKDKIIIIFDVANRYRPNHKNVLFDIYNRYYEIVVNKRKNKSKNNKLSDNINVETIKNNYTCDSNFSNSNIKNINNLNEKLSEKLFDKKKQIFNQINILKNEDHQINENKWIELDYEIEKKIENILKKNSINTKYNVKNFNFYQSNNNKFCKILQLNSDSDEKNQIQSEKKICIEFFCKSKNLSKKIYV